jgi:hypothetical protein
VGDLRQRLDVDHVDRRVADHLGVEGLGPRRHGRAPLVVRAGQEILGRPVYADLAAAAEGHPPPIEIVNVFRPAAEAPATAEQAVAIGAKVVWLQLTVISEPAAEIARAAGLEVVMDRCCKIEHARMFGGLRTIGLNTGLVTSRLAVRFPD